VASGSIEKLISCFGRVHALYTHKEMQIRIPILILLAIVSVWLAPAQEQSRRAKNVILFLADAGGLSTLHAASLLGYNAPQKLHIQSWKNVGLSDTTPVERWVSDSANGMTAIVTGVKTQNGIISQGPDVVRGEKDGRTLKTILEYAEEKGLLTGVVTSQSVADATPAACYAHANDRGKWGEIFVQAFQPQYGDGVDVLLGTGRTRIEAQLEKLGTNFQKLSEKYSRQIASSLEELRPGNKRPIVVADEIDVRAVTLHALDILEKSPNGYFLAVEWDAHTDDAKKGLNRLISFDKLIKEVQGRVDLNETLLIFTADHSFGLLVNGGSAQDNLLDGYEEWEKDKPSGPITMKHLYINRKHTGEDVVAVAIGPGSEQVRGFFPNTHLFHVMLNAWGWKP
jgi:alkaline phosphatase